MTPYDHARPVARKHDLVIQEVADEVLVYDLKTHQAHCLNQTAAAVWKYCDGQKTVADITALVGRETKIDEPAVWLAVQRLGKAQLLEERVQLPAGSPRLGRREAIRRLGIGSAIAVPVVMSIVAPTALAGCTYGNSQAPGAGCCVNSNCASSCCVSGTCTQINGIPASGACCTNPNCASLCCISGTCIASAGLGVDSLCCRSSQCSSGCCRSGAGPGGVPACKTGNGSCI